MYLLKLWYVFLQEIIQFPVNDFYDDAGKHKMIYK